MDAIHGRAMHPRFGFRHRAENSPCELALPRRDAVGPIDDCVNVGEVSVGVLLGMLHADISRAEALLHDRFRRELHPG